MVSKSHSKIMKSNYLFRKELRNIYICPSIKNIFVRSERMVNMDIWLNYFNQPVFIANDYLLFRGALVGPGGSGRPRVGSTCCTSSRKSPHRRG